MRRLMLVLGALGALLGLGMPAPALATPLGYFCRVTDDSGNLVAGATFQVGSTTLTLNTAPVSGSLTSTTIPANAGEIVLGTGQAPAASVVVTLVGFNDGDYEILYDEATYGEIYFPLTISKSGSTITKGNALVGLYCTQDAQQILTAVLQATSAATSSASNATALSTLTTRLPQSILFDGSGYVKSNAQTGNVATVGGLAPPTNWQALSIDSSGRITLTPAEHTLISGTDVPGAAIFSGIGSPGTNTGLARRQDVNVNVTVPGG